MTTRDEDARELRRAAARLGIGGDIRSARIMASVVNDDGGVDARTRRAFIRGLVAMYRKSGTLGRYLEHEPPEGTVWAKFHAAISEAAAAMARERAGRRGSDGTLD